MNVILLRLQEDMFRKLVHESLHHSEWYELLGDLPFSTYRDFVEFTFDYLQSADAGEHGRLRGLFVALARKDQESARFMSDLTVEQREASLKSSEAYFRLARVLYPPEAQEALDRARAAELEHSEQFGWPSVIFDVLDGREPVFRT